MSLAAPSNTNERRGTSPSPRGHASPSITAHHLPPSISSAAEEGLDYARRRSSSRHTGADRPVINSRLITLWTHEPPNFSTQEIVLNPDILNHFGHLGENDLLEVTFPPGISGRPNGGNGHQRRDPGKRFRKLASSRSFIFKPSQGLPESDPSNAATSSSSARPSGQLQLSLSRNIASVYGFYNRAEVILTKVPKADNAISHVELYFRDQYVGRADMWRFTAQMEDTCVYVGQKITLAGSVRAHIGRIFINERKVTSGYVAADTKAIFRSESAKYQLFFQMGKEMWDFDEDGEIYYEKAINGFLPELLQRWKNIPANHVISIILFARIWYDEAELSMLQDATMPVQKEQGPNGRYYIDYYSVLVDLESNCNWTDVMSMLKEEFFRFQHDILLIGRPIAGPTAAPWQEEQHADIVRRDRALLAGRFSASHEGNILEAINLALNPFDEHYIDRDLNRTGFGFILVTAGTGHFRVDKKWLRMTTERMIDNGLGLDLVCLTKMPLHSVPLFHFESHLPQAAPATEHRRRSAGGFASRASTSAQPPDPLYDDSYTTRLNNLYGPPHSTQQGGSASSTLKRSKAQQTPGKQAIVPPPTMQFYSIPHWVDASFYNLQQDQPFRADRFVPRVKMQEIQQIGYMENEISDISLPYLDLMRLASNTPAIFGSSKPMSGSGIAATSGSLGGSGSGNLGTGQSAASSSRMDPASSRKQRKALRERFDAETFRDLEKAPPPVKSNSLFALGSRRSGTSLTSAGLPPGTPLTARREGSLDALSDKAGLTSPSMTDRTGSRSARLGRDSLRGRPALESHAEDEASEFFFREQGGKEASTSTKGVPKAAQASEDSSPNEDSKLFESPQWTPSLSATTSMQSLNRHSQGYFPNVSTTSSRPGSIRSVSTLFRASGLRPLQPVGKAEAFVAPSQPEDLVGDLPADVDGRAAAFHNSPAHAAAIAALNQSANSGKGLTSMQHSPISRRSSKDYLRTVSAGTPRKTKLNPAGWLWSSLTGNGASGSRPSTPGSTNASHPSSPLTQFSDSRDASSDTASLTSSGQVSSAASLRIKALLKGKPASPASSSKGRKLPSQLEERDGAAKPHPISIPVHAQADGGDGGGDDDATPHQRDTKAKVRDRAGGSGEDSGRTNGGPRVASTPRGSGDTGETAIELRFQQEQEAYEQALEDAEAKARYAQHAQVEKQTLVNPSNPRKNLNAKTASHQMLRWQHLWPRRLNRHVVKWRSLTTPACLPLTTFYLPTEQELQDQWAEYPHTLSVSSEFSSFLVKRSASTVPALAIMRELTAQRLAQGFQFIVPMDSRSDEGDGSAGDGSRGAGHDGRDSGKNGTLSSRRYAYRSQRSNFGLNHPSQLFQPGTLTSGNPILLGMSNQIHRITYDRAAGAINVERYIRKMPYDVSPIEYKCCIWPRHTPGYRTVSATFKYPDFGSYAWTRLDSLAAGHSDEDKLSESMKYWRTRFVIVPSEGRPPPMLAPTGEPLDDEEIRLIGMDRLADAFARARWKGRNQISAARTQATALLRFIPTSLDPSMSMWDKEFMRQMEAAIVEDEQVEEVAQAQRRAARKKNIKDTSLDAIAVALSSEKYGLRIEDRVWNRRFYPSAFSGTDLTTWLFCEFTDIKTRDEAIECGSKLMKQGLFEHVHAVHGFLDGHYFYRFKPEWAKKILGARRQSKDEDRGSSTHSRDGSDSTQGASGGGSSKSRVASGGDGGKKAMPPRRMKMSRTLIIDVDPSGKSDRAETAFLHYDISHNPANGFNAQLHWLGTTARFIDDAVQNWTRLVERHGLRLIEAPIGQICDVSQHNPFQAPTQIHLSLAPPTSSSYAHLLPQHTNPDEYFEWCLLRKFGFVLDQEAAHRYPSDVEIIYQSRPARFDHSQFVHRSGVAFVQLLGGQDGFLWLGNRLFNSHIGNRASRDAGGHARNKHGGSLAGQGSASAKVSGIAAGFKGGEQDRGGSVPDPDRARREFAAFCGDPLALHAFYLDVLRDMQKMQQSAGAQQQQL